MQLPTSLPLSDSVTVITAYTTNSDGSSSVSYYHVPAVLYLVVIGLSLYFFNRLLLEFLIRLRRRNTTRPELF